MVEKMCGLLLTQNISQCSDIPSAFTVRKFACFPKHSISPRVEWREKLGMNEDVVFSVQGPDDRGAEQGV